MSGISIAAITFGCILCFAAGFASRFFPLRYPEWVFAAVISGGVILALSPEANTAPGIFGLIGGVLVSIWLGYRASFLIVPRYDDVEDQHLAVDWGEDLSEHGRRLRR